MGQDVGCGVGTTAAEIARRFGVRITAVDISPLMLHRAQANIHSAGLGQQIEVKNGDILALDFADNYFDRVIAEAVTMFVDRPKAARGAGVGDRVFVAQAAHTRGAPNLSG